MVLLCTECVFWSYTLLTVCQGCFVRAIRRRLLLSSAAVAVADVCCVFLQVIENFFERMGSTMSTDERSTDGSERGPSPEDVGMMKKRPLGMGVDLHPVPRNEKKGLSEYPPEQEKKKNRLATSQLVRHCSERTVNREIFISDNFH